MSRRHGDAGIGFISSRLRGWPFCSFWGLGRYSSSRPIFPPRKSSSSRRVGDVNPNRNSVSGGILSNHDDNCNTVDRGYQCHPNISHLWGQNSPYFSLGSESAIPPDVPDGCKVTFVQTLSRHGARFPTHSKGMAYRELVEGIRQNATKLAGKYAFLRDYRYTMGIGDLTAFGGNQLVDSGAKFYQRYEHLARHDVPFIRASGQERVIASGMNFAQGFQKAKEGDKRARKGQETPKVDVIIAEGVESNNTLTHGTCTNFEESKLGDEAAETFASTFVPPIRTRLEHDMPGVTLSNREVIYLMDLCPFDTVSRSHHGREASPFCALFTVREWESYSYAKSVEKYYSFGAGNPLGPTQGIGFTNELIARLTRSPVTDRTSTNHSLDDNPVTFPLDRVLYADFGHDNSMIAAFFAMGLYNGTAPLSVSEVQDTRVTDGYSAAWTVPFGARMYVELMQCRGYGHGEPLVRVLVNDRVVPLFGCEVDGLGMCGRDDFVRGLSWARDGGAWGGCFA